MRIIYPLIGICLITTSGLAEDVQPSRKRAGICFRSDDNHSPEKWLRLMEVFEKYDCHVSAALNLLTVAHRKDYMAFVKDLQERGHEVMDHSPTHRVFSTQFPSEAEAVAYAGKPGVDHVNGKNVYFKYVSPTSMDGLKSGTADIAGSSFASTDTEILAKWAWEPLVMLEGDTSVYLFAGDQKQPTPSSLKTLWGEETVDLPARKGVHFHRLRKELVSVVPDALRHQARLIQAICDQHGIRRPVTWIQPGGSEPVLHRSLVKQVLGDEFGYTAGATYPDASRKCFNEYDPEGDRRFGMQWGNFLEDRYDLERCKATIAHGIARHHVLFGHSHLGGSKEIGGWEGNLRTTEALLQWCKKNDIPVRTYSEWARILYERPTDPTVNVFPDIATDLDGNGSPDGLSLGEKTRLVPDAPEGVKASLSVPGNRQACIVHNLGGIEKGVNTFSLQMRGPVGSKVQARFTSRDAKIETEWLTFEQTQADAWQLFSGEIIVPKQVSRLTIDIRRRDRIGADLLIGDISLVGEAPR